MKHEAPLVGELFTGLPPEAPRLERCTEANYRAACRARYEHPRAYADAKANWAFFHAEHERLLEWVRRYRADVWLKVGDHCHNPEGTLTGLGWLAGRHWPELVDFEERYQCGFLRRGLVIYWTLLLEERV